MKRIVQDKSIFGDTYKVTLNNVVIREIDIVKQEIDIAGDTYIIIFDCDGQVIGKVYEYLNVKNGSDTLSSRRQMGFVLKLFYIYMEIIDKKIVELDDNDYKNLSQFIHGERISGNHIEIEHRDYRSNETHNIYMSALRQYLSWLGFDKTLVFKTRVIGTAVTGHGHLAHTRVSDSKKYVLSKKSNKNSRFVPKYISVEEYGIIVKYIENVRSQFKRRNSVIIDLMYMNGLRLGEVLGLTLEDVQLHPNGMGDGLLLLRNRTSDTEDQSAKGCIRIRDTSEYEHPNYTKEDIGYQKIHLAGPIMSELKQYINESKSILDKSEKKIDNYLKYAKADSVEGKRHNYYVFLNKNHTPLTSVGWGKTLKKVFKAAHIELDVKHKKNNLSHRFRHGYAMFMIEEMKMEIHQVQVLMRHKSIESTRIYYNPKEETILNHSKEIQENILKKINVEN